jgi:hypothetical protein
LVHRHHAKKWTVITIWEKVIAFLQSLFLTISSFFDAKLQLMHVCICTKWMEIKACLKGYVYSREWRTVFQFFVLFCFVFRKFPVNPWKRPLAKPQYVCPAQVPNKHGFVLKYALVWHATFRLERHSSHEMA